jgi:hypothetical protein
MSARPGTTGQLAQQFAIGSQRTLQARHLPLFLDRIFRHVDAEDIGDHTMAHCGNGFRNIVGFQQFVTLLVNDLALVIRYIVVFQQLLADIEVARFDLALRGFQRAGDERMLDRFAFRHFQLIHDGAQTITGKDAQQRIVQTQVETRRTGIALTPGTTTQLVVDTARFVAFGTDDMQTASGQHGFVHLLPFGSQFGDLGITLG